MCKILLQNWGNLLRKFNAFHTVVLKINILETFRHNKYIGHRKVPGIEISIPRRCYQADKQRERLDEMF